MPTYAFVCESCGYELERYVPITYPKKSECPQCHKKTLIRCVGTGGGFIFKGDGFYATDKKNIDAMKENNKMNEERNQRSKEDSEF